MSGVWSQRSSIFFSARLSHMKRSLDVRGKYQILQAYMSAYYPALRSVCLSVCLSASISLEPLNRSSRIFLCRSPVAVARSSSCGVAIPWRSLMSMNALLLIAFCCRQNMLIIVGAECLVILYTMKLIIYSSTACTFSARVEEACIICNLL